MIKHGSGSNNLQRFNSGLGIDAFHVYLGLVALLAITEELD